MKGNDDIMKKIVIYYKKTNRVKMDNIDCTGFFEEEELKIFKKLCSGSTLQIECYLGIDECGLYLQAFGIRK